jgi:crotonobetaine/carnitine-CoA ligase
MTRPDAATSCFTIGDLVRERAAASPRQRGVTIDGVSLSYAEIDARSDAVAAALARRGVRKGDRVACLMFNCIEHLLVWFGAVKLGAVWVPFNVSLTGDDLRHVLQDAAPSVVFVDGENLARLEAVRWAGECVGVGTPERPGLHGFDAYLAGCEAPARVELGPGDPAVIVYTGGTTGLPKGVVLPHFAWIAAGMRYARALDITDADSHYSVLPMFHVGGLMAGVIGPLFSGIPTTLDRWFSASAFWQRVNETGASIIDPIGTMLAVLAKADPSPLETSHRVRMCFGAFGQLARDKVEAIARRFRLEFLNLYSLSEAGGLIIVNNPPHSPRPQANGKASEWVDIMVADARGFPAPPGVQGEILLRPRVAHTFMTGYHGAPERTLAVFRNLWLHTGDVGYLDEEGYLFYTGRQAHFLRRRGENISAYEVESVLQRHESVAEAAVVGLPSELGEDDVKAFVIPAAGRTADPVQLYHWCREHLAYFKAPRFIEIAPDLPRSATKREIERHKLKAMPNDKAWDAEAVFGRASLRAR